MASATNSRLSLQKMEIIDLPIVSKLERESYPPEEAASTLVLEYRIIIAEKLCYVAFLDGSRDVSGFIVGTAAPDDTKRMAEEMMKDHYPPGNVLCIHSVVMEKSKRKRGLGSEMMRAYLKKIKETTHIKRVLLLSKQRLVPFYENLGFHVLGESKIVHGNERWIEMTKVLTSD